jgi:hypothetical protein
MSRRLLTLLVFAILSPGCVPVTHPVGDVDKTEPDKTLVGKWTTTDGDGIPKALEVKAITVDAPAVKGNPKGLMRAILTQDGRDTELWFFTATVGKHTYVSLILSENDNDLPPKFNKEGDFAKWKEQTKKYYYVYRYASDGDRLTLDSGHNEKFDALMKDAKIESDGGQSIKFYDTPAGWLDKYLDKTGPAKLFDETNYLKLKREKK